MIAVFFYLYVKDERRKCEKQFKEIVEFAKFPTGDFLNAIAEVHKAKKSHDYIRRISKLGEEFGELCEAHLGVTSSHNYKNKTWDDVREEAIDASIVAIDIALTASPDEKAAGVTDDEIKQRIMTVLRKKIYKWVNSQSYKNSV